MTTGAKHKPTNMTKTKKAVFRWVSREVFVADIAPTPKNYKIRNDLGMERLRASLQSFGMAGTMVCNWAGKYGNTRKLVLIDGNSRREEAIAKGEKKVWVSLPHGGALTPAQFKEMSAMFDYAKAGDVDIESINSDLGKTKDFYDKYKMQVPIGHLDKMGKNAPKPEKGLQYPGGKAAEEQQISDTRMVQLFFDSKQEEQFRKLEEKLRKKYKTQNTTDTVFRAVKEAAK